MYHVNSKWVKITNPIYIGSHLCGETSICELKSCTSYFYIETWLWVQKYPKPGSDKITKD